MKLRKKRYDKSEFVQFSTLLKHKHTNMYYLASPGRHIYMMATCIYQLLTLLHKAVIYKIHTEELSNQVIRKNTKMREFIIFSVSWDFVHS